MARCLIGLGSNLGNRREMLERALAELRGHSQIQVIAVSSFHETAPIGGPAGQPFYLNAVAALDCSLPPDGLLQLLEQIELKHGRRREETWGPRTLDLDLLLYEDIVLSTPRLELPHPRMAWRRFVLEPAAEVAQDVLHPTIGWTIGRLLEHLNTALPYVAITGTIATGKTQLAGILCEKISARLISESIDENLLETFYADPAGHAWTMELEFLGERTTLLSSDAVIWSEHSQWVVSDFWFDQSPGFARAWLDQSQWPAYQELWQQARQKVVGPKLLVLLDAPSEVLLDRISRRARCGEQNLNPAQLERIRQSILDQASQPDVGPVLRPKSADMSSIFNEVLAAIQAMA